MSDTTATDAGDGVPHTDTVLPDPVSGAAYDEPSAAGTERGLIIETSEGAQELFPRTQTGSDELLREAGGRAATARGRDPQRRRHRRRSCPTTRP